MTRLSWYSYGTPGMTLAPTVEGVRTAFNGQPGAHGTYSRWSTNETWTPPFTFSGRIKVRSRLTPFTIGGQPVTYTPSIVWHVASMPDEPGGVNANNLVVGIGGVGAVNVGASAELYRPDTGRSAYGVRTGYVSRLREPSPDPVDGQWHTFRAVMLSYERYQLWWDGKLIADIVEKAPASMRGRLSTGLRLDGFDVELADLDVDDGRGTPVTLPIAPVQLPLDLIGQSNGQLSASLLSTVDGGGKLHHLAARAWRALVAAAWSEAQLPLTFTHGGTYRTYAAQEALFRSRYDPSGTGGGCKTWNGVRWCKKSPNLATAAVPGTSNHGWGLAIDTAWDRDTSDGLGPDDATGITSHPGWPWLLANAHRFGFSWELQSEPWHLRYVDGDSIPTDVLLFENPTTPPPIDPGDTDMLLIVVHNPTEPKETWLTWTGAHLAHVVGHAAFVHVEAKTKRVDITDGKQADSLIQSSTTTTPVPPEWELTPRGALWTSARG